jgi:hypothetical protein
VNLCKKILATAAILTASASATAGTTCNWNSPGSNPQIGDKIASLENYKDIPADVRAELGKKMAAKKYDDHVVIGRNYIRGNQDYVNARDMHWGQNKICFGEVVRSAWKETQTHRALVYSYAGYSIAVASVCGNVFRLDIIAGGGGGGNSSAPPADSSVPAIPDEPTSSGGIPPADSSTFSEMSGGGGAPTPEQNLPPVVWLTGKVPPQNPLVPDEPTWRPVPIEPVPHAPLVPFVRVEIPPVVVPVPVMPPVPEPSTYAMMLAGLFAMGMLKKKGK